MAVSLDLLMNAVISGLLLGGFYAAVSVGVVMPRRPMLAYPQLRFA